MIKNTKDGEESGGGDFGESIEQTDGQETPVVRATRTSLSGGMIDSSTLMAIKALEEVTSMSARERNRILESIHGVGGDDNNERNDEMDRGNYLLTEELRRNLAASHDRQSSKPARSSPSQPDKLVRSWTEQHARRGAATTHFHDHDFTTLIDKKARSDGEQDVAPKESPLHQNGRGEQAFEEYDYHSTIGVAEQLADPPMRSLPLPASLQTDDSGFIMEKLKELDEAIGHIQHKAAYIQALQKYDGYVEDPKFRLIFLRANSYDAKKAAARLVSFMDEKLHRFGPEALTRQLTMDDLSKTSRSLLVKRGVMQILPTRDSTGRAVLVTYFHFFRLQDELRRHPASLGDLIFYLLSVMAEDQETQRRGIVTVGVIVSPSWNELEFAVKFLHSSLKDIGASIERWCPLKCNAHHHWLYDNAGAMTWEITTEDPPNRTSAGESASSSIMTTPSGIHDAQEPEPRKEGEHGESSDQAEILPTTISGQVILDTIMGCMGREYRIRTRVHEGCMFGEYKEILKTFGIAGNRLPFTMDGSEIRASGAHIKWIQKRREKEAALISHRLPRKKKGTGSTSSGKTLTRGGGNNPTPVQPKRGAESKSNEGTSLSCFDVIDIPGRHDVCLGKGTGLHQHSGNIAMRAMMEPLLKEYDTATSTRRQELNKIILQAIRLIGGRFLTNRDSPSGAWFTIELDDNAVEKTIGGIFRSMVSRTKNNPQQNDQPVRAKESLSD